MGRTDEEIRQRLKKREQRERDQDDWEKPQEEPPER